MSADLIGIKNDKDPNIRGHKIGVTFAKFLCLWRKRRSMAFMRPTALDREMMIGNLRTEPAGRIAIVRLSKNVPHISDPDHCLT